MSINLCRGYGELLCSEVKPINHFTLKTPAHEFVDDGNSISIHYTNKILAEVLDTTDKAIVDAIVKEAAAQGVNDLFLIDKEFIMSAIKNEMIRRGEKELTYGDIYDDFRKQYPTFSTCVLDYRPAIELLRTIVLWTKNGVYHYSYDTKKAVQVEHRDTGGRTE